MEQNKSVSEYILKHNKYTIVLRELKTGKQREYTDFIKNAKREVTKTSRLDKIIPVILDKKGLTTNTKIVKTTILI
jgi:uncharacterized protein YdeI (YjbR/CyaY-like superfamily)